MKHEYIGLLEHLRARHPLEAEQEVGRDRPPWRDVGDHKRFQPEETGKLLIQAADGIVAIHKGVSHTKPGATLSFVDAVRANDRDRRALKVPASHHVRKGVVVDGLV